MFNLARGTVALGALALASGAFAQTITVSAAFAPNIFGSSASFNAFSANVISALGTGANTAGDPTQPSYYQNVAGGTFDPHFNIATDFNSFKGSVAAANGNFASETGTRATFPVSVVSPTAFVLNDFYGQFVSNDRSGAGGTSELNQPDRVYFTGSTFANFLVGLSYGPDGMKGTADDVTYNASNPGNDMTLINELRYDGDGTAFAVLTDAGADSQMIPRFPGATNQQKIDNEVARIGGYTLSEVYGFRNGPSASATLRFQPVPEPATMAALGLGALGLLRRRKAAK